MAQNSTTKLSTSQQANLASKLDKLEFVSEWEALHPGFHDLTVTKFGPHTGDLGKLTLTRDDEYRISAAFQTSLDRAAIEELSSCTTGRLVHGYALEAVDWSMTKFHIPKCVVRDFSLIWSVDAPPSARIDLVVSSPVTHIFVDPPLDKARSCTDWFLGGPDQFPYPRRTVRERHMRFVRRRSGISNCEDAPILVHPPLDRPHHENNSADYLLLSPNNDIRAIVAAVPSQYGPQWSNSIGIEYHYDSASCPADDTREGISEAMGFLFGCHLLPVGSTSYDVDGYPVEEHVHNPWGRDIISTCRSPAMPPLRITRETAEKVFGHITNQYLQKREELQLQGVLWNMWIAQRMPVGFDLPLYSSALERLMYAWFKSAGSRSKGIYMAKKAFDGLLRDELASIEGKLRGQQYADRIAGRIKNAYQMGVNERFEVFLEELGLTCGDYERRVIKARNSSAHGGRHSGTDAQEQVKIGRGYQTLLNRVILKVLGYVGTYVDYSVDGHQEKPLDEPIGPF